VLKDAGAARPADNLLRLSVGIEDAGDLWRDLANALLRDDEPVAAPARAPLRPQAVAG
jgi:hypothetical protein